MTYPTLKFGSRGPAVTAAKLAYNAWNAKKANTTAVFGVLFRSRIKEFQKIYGIPASGVIGPRTWERLERYLTPEAKQLLGVRVVPDLGPVVAGGQTVLEHDLTHATSGIPLYPAFDDAFREGAVIIAPEDLTVTKASSSRPGDACYAQGASGIRYWFGHLAYAPEPGTRIRKGATVGRTCENHIGGGPHVHLGINVEKLLGVGRELQHKTGYQHGAPTVGAQLQAWADA